MRDDPALTQAMLDAMPAEVAVLDDAGAIVSVNRAWRRFANANAASVPVQLGIGINYLDVCRRAADGEDADARAALEGIRRVLDGRLDEFVLEYSCHAPAQWRWFIMRVVRIPGRGAVISHSDISHRRLASVPGAPETVRQREHDLATAFRVNPQPMFIVRISDQRYVEVNEPWERLTGYSRSEAIGRTSVELGLYGAGHDRTRFYVELQRAGAVREFEFDTLDRRGQVRRVVVSAEVADIGGEPCVIGAVSDITERRQIEVERARLLQAERDARREAERANQIKDEFLATVSHELRTPLNAMLGWSHILARRGDDPAMLKEGLSVIGRNARAQAQLIADLLDMSRIVSGKLRLETQSVDLHDVVRAAVETVGPAAQAKGIRIRVALEPRIGPVQGDPQRLQQVVWNLLSNAVKFTQRQGEVEVVVTREADAAQIRVWDTGQGIAAELLPHVFDRFRQADSSTTRRHGGLGLGLSIVKQLVELHGGVVRADSPGVDCGSTFLIQLPLLDAEAEQPEEPVAAPTSAGAPSAAEPQLTLAGVTVLAVDDEPDALSVVRRLLEDRQARVLTACSADEALTLIAAKHPDVLLSDIGMPDVDGYELIRRIRASEAGAYLPALALTAYARTEDQVRALRAGYQAHVAKPLQPAELVEKVALLAGRMPAED
jgi:PAS domain S-box-containing protein